MRTIITNLVAAQIDAFVMHHKDGIFTKREFTDFLKEKQTLNLKATEINKAFYEMLRLGVFAGKNQRSYVVTEKRVTNYKLFVSNIRSPYKGRVAGTKVKRKVVSVDIEDQINNADQDTLDKLELLLNSRRAVLNEIERVNAIVASLLSLADCENKAQLIELINKSTLN